MDKERVLPKIEAFIQSLATATIAEERKAVLSPLAHYIKHKLAGRHPIVLNFICTHNSRRSHLAQVWAQTLAHHLGIGTISCYSGGTEATAMYPAVVETLKNIGFEITKLAGSKNSVYSIRYAVNAHPIIGFSKTFDHPFNPKDNFAAIMTCSSADEGCPFVGGSESRFSITYEDPKAFDDSPQKVQKYQERSIQIATELLFVYTQ